MIALTNTTNKDKDRITVSWIRKKKKKTGRKPLDLHLRCNQRRTAGQN